MLLLDPKEARDIERKEVLSGGLIEWLLGILLYEFDDLLISIDLRKAR